MRTTVTLDPEVELLLKKAMNERGISFKKALNEAVKAGLSPQKRSAPKPFELKTYSMGFDPKFPWEKASAIADALEDEELIRKLALGK